MHTYTETRAILENGHMIPEPGIYHFLRVGDTWHTQWGPRTVVRLETATYRVEPQHPDA